MKMHAAHRLGGHRRSATVVRLAAGLSIVGCAVALSACGASGGSGQSAVGATTATGNASPLGLSQCVRAHGVPSFADLTSAPIGVVVATKRLDVNASSPAFRHAITLCGDPPGLRVRR